MQLNNPFTAPKKRKKYMFHQDSRFKFGWDLAMALVLMTICVVMPVHIAFDSQTELWCKIYLFTDLLFLVDMVFSFFTSLPMKKEGDEIVEEVTDRKIIAVKYLTTWFIIELLAILPVDVIFSSLTGEKPHLCPTSDD